MMKGSGDMIVIGGLIDGLRTTTSDRLGLNETIDLFSKYPNPRDDQRSSCLLTVYRMFCCQPISAWNRRDCQNSNCTWQKQNGHLVVHIPQAGRRRWRIQRVEGRPPAAGAEGQVLRRLDREQQVRHLGRRDGRTGGDRRQDRMKIE